MRRKHRVCEIHGCAKKHHAKGMCMAHYQRARRHGWNWAVCDRDGTPYPVRLIQNRTGPLNWRQKLSRTAIVTASPDDSADRPG